MYTPSQRSGPLGGKVDGEADEWVDREEVGVPEHGKAGHGEHGVEQVRPVPGVGAEPAAAVHLPRQHERRQPAWRADGWVGQRLGVRAGACVCACVRACVRGTRSHAQISKK